jgi:hypothetical protein
VRQLRVLAELLRLLHKMWLRDVKRLPSTEVMHHSRPPIIVFLRRRRRLIWLSRLPVVVYYMIRFIRKFGFLFLHHEVLFERVSRRRIVCNHVDREWIWGFPVLLGGAEKCQARLAGIWVVGFVGFPVFLVVIRKLRKLDSVDAKCAGAELLHVIIEIVFSSRLLQPLERHALFVATTTICTFTIIHPRHTVLVLDVRLLCQIL